MEHTKGPWKHDETWGLIKHGKTEIAALHSGNKANAKLIAAAPELLEACKLAVERLEINNCEGEERAFIQSITTAINKAEL